MNDLVARLPPEFIEAVADRVADVLEERARRAADPTAFDEPDWEHVEAEANRHLDDELAGGG